MAIQNALSFIYCWIVYTLFFYPTFIHCRSIHSNTFVLDQLNITPRTCNWKQYDPNISSRPCFHGICWSLIVNLASILSEYLDYKKHWNLYIWIILPDRIFTSITYNTSKWPTQNLPVLAATLVLTAKPVPRQSVPVLHAKSNKIL